MINTNSKKYQENFKKYILDVIETTEDLPKAVKTDEQKLNFVWNRFKGEYVNLQNLQRYKGSYTKMMSAWLSGLALDIPYTNYGIIELTKELQETDKIKNPDAVVNNYFDFMAKKLMKLISTYNKKIKDEI
tara:strand:+ start:221 stop:613 length:393 start_codon:yes stop_codon:yes gene_type:complete